MTRVGVTTESSPPPGLALVRLISPLVPSHRRAEWLAEWDGELQHVRLEARRHAEPAWLTRHGAGGRPAVAALALAASRAI